MCPSTWIFSYIYVALSCMISLLFLKTPKHSHRFTMEASLNVVKTTIGIKNTRFRNHLKKALGQFAKWILVLIFIFSWTLNTEPIIRFKADLGSMFELEMCFSLKTYLNGVHLWLLRIRHIAFRYLQTNVIFLFYNLFKKLNFLNLIFIHR